MHRYQPGKHDHNGDVVPQTPSKNAIQTAATDKRSNTWLQPYPPTLRARVPWVATLCVSLRLTDWTIGVLSHDKCQPAPIQPLRSYFSYIALHALCSYLLLNATSYLLATREGGDLLELFRLLANTYAALSLYTYYLPTFLSLPAHLLYPELRSSTWSPLNSAAAFWECHFPLFRRRK